MGNEMEKGAGLTAQQEQLLDLAVRDPYIIKTFYLSGGTALSSWYLHHRESFDLDFFSLAPFDYDQLVRWFRQNDYAIGYSSARYDEDYGFLTVNLRYPDRTMLKIDFNHYSNTVLAKGMVWQGLTIDSLLDITVNKLQTIATLPRTRDYIDLYFIHQKNRLDLNKEIKINDKKFKTPIDPLQLAKNFLKVAEYTDFPNMLVPFDAKKMHRFYEKLATSLKPKILR